MADNTSKEDIKDDNHASNIKKANEKGAKKTGNRKQNRNEASAKKPKDSKRVRPADEQIELLESVSKKGSLETDISPFVSNVEGNVYAITGLPEEFIATLFAWVSRSNKSFKDHLRQALKDKNIEAPLESFKELDEKAKKFHEKWTVGYGHSSVAEHATAHVGIEKISRLASAELELSNPFLSITEYSQRYQKPKRGGWHNPIKKRSKLYKEVENFYHEAFDAFENLIDGVYTHLKKQYVDSAEYEDIKDDQKAVDKKLAALLKLAFEDARYVLPLAMHTQLGMTANGRAWRDSLATFSNSRHKESQEVADNIRTEISKVLPVLLKYSTPSQYQRNSQKRMEKLFLSRHNKNNSSRNTDVQLLNVQSEAIAINTLIACLQQQYSNLEFQSAAYLVENHTDTDTKEEVINELLMEISSHDMAPEVFKHIRYNAYFNVSEANWHQLLRHNRMTDFTATLPSPDNGVTIPPRIVNAGLQDIVKCIARKSEELYTKLIEEGFESEAEYVVLNAHKRLIYASFSLWEAYHLINLRTSEDAQWDIRQAFEQLYKQLKSVHPLLIGKAKRRSS
ncbi:MULTISPECIES: FAD-dependent thymidylate synthase [Bacillus subtilis group]|uniref:FAD-dependent thymidylate synthase n=1 Tax=Bacillus subtilis group TaxID=653685 RepID=UPI001B086620|nr:MULTISPECIES: FAD-dependent thymidylate synthase [Bacillus subtilis group]MED4337855.1 FAD-dependent thymidylate synthase [Bacillus licheniformis]MED4371141.1 FAD-dependent thymidylate synthase [Bacillus licheniformis]GIN55057.1 thymidylate synthase [Bacillus paralicheniformis]